MQRSTLNCNVPLTGYSRTYRYAFIYVYIYIYISTLAEKSLEIYIYILLRAVKGRPPSMAWARTHAQPHKTHTSSRVRRCRSHYVSSSCFWGRGGPPRIPLVFKTRWQLTVCDGNRGGTINDARKRFYARAGYFVCVSVRLFCCFFSSLTGSLSMLEVINESIIKPPSWVKPYGGRKGSHTAGLTAAAEKNKTFSSFGFEAPE